MTKNHFKKDFFIVVPENISNFLIKDDFPAQMTTIEAFELSILKWETIYKFHTSRGKKRDYEVRNSADRSCALCEKFRKVDFEGHCGCTHCPIFIKTNDSCCGSTPYSEYIGIDFGRKSFAAAAKREVEFLKKLLEEYK